MHVDDRIAVWDTVWDELVRGRSLAAPSKSPHHNPSKPTKYRRSTTATGRSPLGWPPLIKRVMTISESTQCRTAVVLPF